jgi:ribose 1,5-bisphosphokinase PhnN
MTPQTAHRSPHGDSLIQALARLVSVDTHRPERILKLGMPLSVIVVGGMCAGKSTLAHGAAQHPVLAGCYEVVPRCSTRESRQGDEADGVTSISWDEFRERRTVGTFELSWERPLADGSSIGYGCFKPSVGRVPILMGGHGIYTNRATVQPPTALEGALIVGVAAPADVRAERLRLRSPDVVGRGEAATGVLMAHDDGAMAINVDILVRNYDATEVTVVNDFACALALVANYAGYNLRGAI